MFHTILLKKIYFVSFSFFALFDCFFYNHIKACTVYSAFQDYFILSISYIKKNHFALLTLPAEPHKVLQYPVRHYFLHPGVINLIYKLHLPQLLICLLLP